MTSSEKSKKLPLEKVPDVALLNVVDFLDPQSAWNLRNTSTSMRDLVNLREEKFYCENYPAYANNLYEKCKDENFSEKEKFCNEKYNLNLCGPLNVKAFVIEGTNTVTVPYGTTWVGRNTFKDINIDKFEVVLPKTVKNIDTAALEWNTNVIKVSAPGVEKIQNRAFFNCKALMEFHAPLLEKIEREAFYMCKSLQTVYAPRVKEIGEEAFWRATLLETVEFPQVLKIGRLAFSLCDTIEEFNAPLLKSIGIHAFAECNSLQYFSAPQAEHIELDAFLDCPKLQQLPYPRTPK